MMVKSGKEKLFWNSFMREIIFPFFIKFPKSQIQLQT